VPLVTAYTTLTFTGVGVADETVELGSHTYTFKVAPSAAFEVDIKTDATTQASALASAINLDGTAGAYGASHVLENPQFSASSAAGVVTVTSRVSGTIGNGHHIAFTATNGTNITAGPISDSAGYSAGTGDFQAFVDAALTGILDAKAKSVNAFRELIA
jgi:hypothetical protein